MFMLNAHEFSGTMTFETNLGLETVDFAYSLILGPDADENILEQAGKAIAQFILKETIDDFTIKSTKYHPN